MVLISEVTLVRNSLANKKEMPEDMILFNEFVKND
jgi:hypothetical protein